jgi:hypothetical protein
MATALALPVPNIRPSSTSSGVTLHLSPGRDTAASGGSAQVYARQIADIPWAVPPQSVLFGNLDPYAPGWRIRQPLMVNFICDEDGSAIISDEVFPIYGTGDTISEAMADYVTSLVELYEIVEQDVADQVPHTEDELARLAFYLTRHQ